MRALTFTYRTIRVQNYAGGSQTTEVQPGRVVNVDTASVYVRDGCLFYRAVSEPEGSEHMVPVDQLYHLHIGAEQEVPRT